MCIKIILFAVFIHGYALKNEMPEIARLYRTGLENWVHDSVLGDAAFDQVDSKIDPAGHFDGATERDFTIPLRKVDVAHGKSRSLHVNRKIDFRSAAQVLDVAVAAMFARGDRARGFSGGHFCLRRAHPAK